MRAAWLLLLTGCAGAPDVALTALESHSTKLGTSTSPGPHYGYVLVGQADATLIRGVPEELRGAHGSVRFLPGMTRTTVIDGVLHFVVTVAEKDYRQAVGFLNYDPNVRIDFDGGVVAAGRIVTGKAFYGEGLEDLHPAWKTK